MDGLEAGRIRPPLRTMILRGCGYLGGWTQADLLTDGVTYIEGPGGRCSSADKELPVVISDQRSAVLFFIFILGR